MKQLASSNICIVNYGIHPKTEPIRSRWRHKLCIRTNSINGECGKDAGNCPVLILHLKLLMQSQRWLPTAPIVAVGADSNCCDDGNWQLNDGCGEKGICRTFQCGRIGVKGIGMVSFLIGVIKNMTQQLNLTIFAIGAIWHTSANENGTKTQRAYMGRKQNDRQENGVI